MKEFEPINETLLGIVIDLRDEHPSHVLLEIELKVVGNVKEVRDVQPRKAEFP